MSVGVPVDREGVDEDDHILSDVQRSDSDRLKPTNVSNFLQETGLDETEKGGGRPRKRVNGLWTWPDGGAGSTTRQDEVTSGCDRHRTADARHYEEEIMSYRTTEMSKGVGW